MADGLEKSGGGAEDEVESPMEAFEEWQRRYASGEALAVPAKAEVPVVKPGTMRLTGNFSGFATTSTHHLELDVGLDLEMPSKVAADAMRQLATRSRSSSPMPARLCDAQELPPQKGSLFSSLAGFFRKDARDAAGASQALEDIPKLSLSDVQLSIEGAEELLQLRQRCSLLEEDSQRLQLELEASREEVSRLAAERLGAVDGAAAAAELEAVRLELAAAVAHGDGLQHQVELLTAGRRELEGQLAEREAEVRSLDESLTEARRQLHELVHDSSERALDRHEELLREADALRTERDEAVVAQHQAAKTLSTVQHDVRVLLAENDRLKAEVARLREALVQSPSSSPKSTRSFRSPRSGPAAEADLRQAVAQLEAQNAEISAACQAVQSQLREAVAGREGSDAQVARITEQMDALVVAERARRERAAELEEELLQLHARADDAAALEKQAAELQARLLEAEGGLEQMRQQVAAAIRESSTARAEAARLRAGLRSEAAAEMLERARNVSRELADAGPSMKALQSDRDALRGQLRELQRRSLDDRAKMLEELREARQAALEMERSAGELAALRQRCAALEASHGAMVQEVHAHRAAPLLVQDPTSSCVIRSLPTVVTTAAAPSATPCASSSGMGTYTAVAPSPCTPGTGSFVSHTAPVSPTGAFVSDLLGGTGTSFRPVPSATVVAAPPRMSLPASLSMPPGVTSVGTPVMSSAGSPPFAPAVRVARASAPAYPSQFRGAGRNAVTVRVVNVTKLSM